MMSRILINLLLLCINPINATYMNSYIISDNYSTEYNYYQDGGIPIVVLHGVASSSSKMQPFSEWLSHTFNRTVYNLEIGNGEKTSLYTPLPIQLNELCDIIYSIDDLKDGFDFIGMSQGGLLARGYVEQCNIYPVFNLITLVSPHGGVIKDINLDMYSDFIQDHLSVGGYWRDPLQLSTYLDKCNYLPLLNNEKESYLSEQQKMNIKSLDNFVLVWSREDTTVTPSQSAKFSFYDKNFNIIDIEDTELYKEDLLGLKYLNEYNKFHIYETNCTHVEHRDPVCYDQLYNIFISYL